VEQICDRVVVIDRGRLVQAGRLQDLLEPAIGWRSSSTGLSEETEREAVSRGAAVSRTEPWRPSRDRFRAKARR